MTLHLSPADWVVLGLYFCIPLAVGLAFRKKGGKDSGSFLLSGRSLPWWLAGTSMAADTFASDAPLYVCRIVRRSGIAANWEWWCFAFSGLLSVFLLAPLWRRTSTSTLALSRVWHPRDRRSMRAYLIDRAETAAIFGLLGRTRLMMSWPRVRH